MEAKDRKKARNDSYYIRTQNARLLKEAIKSIIKGRIPIEKTLKKYAWKEREINKIRALDSTFRLILEDKHGISLEDIYKNKAAQSPIRIADVQEEYRPAPPPRPDYPQGLEETPAKGFNTPITWRQIETFWTGNIEKHTMGSNAKMPIMKDGELVGAKYKPGYTKQVRATFRMIREEFANKELDDNAVPTLKKVDEILAFLRDKYRKSEKQIQADMTVQDSSVGAVAGKDDDDDEEISSGPRVIMSKPATATRARDKSSILKNVTATYSSKIGHIATTFGAWKVFRDSLGTDILQQYRGTFEEGQVGLFQAIVAAKEVQKNKTKSELHAVPSYEMLLRYLPKIKDKLGVSTKYLAAYLQVKLLGLRDNLGGIEIRDTDGKIYDPSIGDSSRADWYNRKSGRLYIAHFKTSGSTMGRPYDFQLKDMPEVKAVVDETLAPGHPESKRKWLVGVGVGSEKNQTRSNLPKPVGSIIGKAFADAGLLFPQLHLGKYIFKGPTPVDVRHAQVTWKHREMTKKNPSLTSTQISEKIAGFFNHASDINIGYLRKTFDTLQDPLAKKSGNSKELTPIEEEKEKPKNLKIKLKIKKIEKSPKDPMPTLKTPENLKRSTRIRIKAKKYS